MTTNYNSNLLLGTRDVRAILALHSQDLWEKIYNRINWKDRPSTATSLGSTNLNRMDVAINTLDNRVIQLQAEKLGIDVANSMVASWVMDMNNYEITVTLLDGTVKKYDLNLERIPIKTELSENGILTFTYADGTQDSINIADLIKDTIYDDSDNIAFSKEFKGNAYHVTAVVKNNSIEERHLKTSLIQDIRNNSNIAQTAANDSLTYSKDSKRWAVGDTEYEGSEVDNSKYYCELSEAAKVAAEKARDEAQAVSSVEIATTKKAGIVKPDGVTITVDADGTIHGADTTDIATTTQAGIVKPDGKTIGVAEDGTISSIIKAASLLITDTQGLKVSVGKETTTQLLIDAIADRIVNHIVTNEVLTAQLTNYITKSMITNQAVNDATKVTGAALSYAQQQELERLNSNLGTYKLLMSVTGKTAITLPDKYIEIEIVVNHGYICTTRLTKIAIDTLGNGAVIRFGTGPANTLFYHDVQVQIAFKDDTLHLDAMYVGKANNTISEVSASTTTTVYYR